MSNVLKVETPKSEPIKTGVSADVRAQLAKHLSVMLAESYMLTVKSHLYHWNVVGPLFKSIHDLTEEHYEDMFAATDELAERIRALGHRAPVNVQDGKLNLTIQLPSGGMPDAHDMIADLVESHETISAEMRDMATYAGDNGDVVTEDLLTERITFHEKAAWMLRALITE
ncbi:starvation-inducible DNA-binding protein [Roseibium hamelinense]|uniref:Starvation-inducible DNA-binding protein n=1 Tax=Roseibium hamelinense TaxID=150831 RepID=A0A562SG22_9HYPH|nr:DNA starvation/stationary phase protection protein [Roseibium hamelinense]MTI42182.1 DNA starvation/stationary phase protection protein [Roseibium hamelinense]TWI79516.1 starvation-inducible DNA-binding protein [Roseibium hamelinense]